MMGSAEAATSGACNFIKKKNLAQVFCCEFLTKHLRTTASRGDGFTKLDIFYRRHKCMTAIRLSEEKPYIFLIR